MSFGNQNKGTVAPARSKYGGIQCACERSPMLDVGTYRCRIIKCEEGYNPGKRRASYKTTMQVVDVLDESSRTQAGSTCTIIGFDSAAGLAEVKRLVMHAAGYGPTLADRSSASPGFARDYAESERAYDEMDEGHGYQGSIIEASAGASNGAPSVVGRLVDVRVYRAKDIVDDDDGRVTDYYRGYTFGSVPEEEQS